MNATGPADEAPTLLLCSETDDLSGLCADFEAAAARDCPVLRVACWTPDTPPAVLDRVVAIAGWFVPVGLPARLPRLRLLASIGAGVEHLLRDPDLPPGLPVTRIVDPAQARGMAEYVLWAALHFHRDLDRVLAQQTRREWRMPAQRLTSAYRVGIMGLGAMGAEVARTLAAHGFDVHGWARRPAALDGLTTWAGPEAMRPFLAGLDMMVSLLPLTPETRNLFNADWFAVLKPGAVFVNCGRGEQLVVPALQDALRSGHLRAAVLDVFEHEPLPADDPLWTEPGVVITPHMASSASAEVIAGQIVENTARAMARRALLHAVDRLRGY